MRKITRKQAVSNMQCLFDDFFKTYFNAPKEAIEETIENATFGEQKERLRKAVYSTEYNTILGQLDSESFRKYYEKVGEFAKAYNIDTKLFTEETPAVIEDINDVLGESPNITEKLDHINGFTDEELRTDRISFGTKTALIESILDCWFVGDDKEQGINRMLMSLTADDRLAFVNKIGTDRKFLNRLIQCVNGREKDEMLAILGEIFISTGFTDGKDSISLNNDGNDRVTESFEREKIIINITKVQAYGMRARATNRKIEASPLDIITMNYDGMIIRVPAFLLLNSWSNTFATQEGIFFNYKYEDIDWNSLDERQKDEYFSEFVRHYMGEALFSELVGNPLGLIVTTIVGILLLWVASIPAAFMAVVGAGIAGTNVYAGAKLLTTSLEKKKNATSMHEFKKAAKLFAESIAKIGVNVLMLIVSLVQTGKAVYKGKTISINEKPNAKRIEKQVEIKFKIKEKFDATEYRRQLKNQEDGLNKLTIQEYLDNIKEYKSNGRGTDAAKLQKKVREKAFEDKVDELLELNPEKSIEEIELEASQWLKTQAALHNPDMSAGGSPLDVTRVGDARINSSIGSQWRNGNAELLETQIRDSIKNIAPKDYTTTFLNVKLTTE